MGPVIWTDRRATGLAAAAVAWLLAVELGTSRTASRDAAGGGGGGERVVDRSTSAQFDRAAAVALVGAVVVSRRLPGATIRFRRSSFTVGAALLVGSDLLSRSARRHLGRFHRQDLTLHPDHEVVDTGPYALVRHPLYLATLGVFTGIGALLGNWIGLLLAPALPGSVLVRRMRIEETLLEDAVGADYVAYQARTSRIIPGLW